MNEEQQQAYDAGRAAAARGEPRQADPFITGSAIDTIPDRTLNLSIHWNRGWDDAREAPDASGI